MKDSDDINYQVSYTNNKGRRHTYLFAAFSKKAANRMANLYGTEVEVVGATNNDRHFWKKDFRRQ